MPSEVRIREVGPRDGLQAEKPVKVADRIRLIDALAAAGVSEIEAVSFVSPKAVPSMAKADQVLAGVERRPGVSYMALVPNVRGAEMALAAGVDGLSVTISASPAYNEKNVNRSIEESVEQIEQICRLANGLWVDAVVSCAFGSPYEGDLDAVIVAGLGRRLMEVGATSLTFADTTGMATPAEIASLVALTGSNIRLHLHETRGTGLVNAYAAMQLGVADFDTSIGGLGGSPFASGAAGNLATEALVYLADGLGLSTGIDLEGLLEASALVARLIGRPVPAPVAAAGPRLRLSKA
ncbi:MAG: hydroxymethylglutaryl-CoA lyase [Acidimicrobiales bacterium]